MDMPAPVAPPPQQQHQEEEGIHDMVVQRISESLRQTTRHGDELDIGSPTLADRLARHVRRLPRRFLIDYLYLDAGEDFLLHWRILDDCADPNKRPIFHARFMKAVPMAVYRSAPYYLGDGDEATADDQELLHDDPEITFLPVHEIVFSSVHRPRVLCRLTALVSEVGLNVREAHVFTTVDGLSLAIFLVDGWETEDAGDLITKLKETSALYSDLS